MADPRQRSGVMVDGARAAWAHDPVLLETVRHWLLPVPRGSWIVDGTVGLGGHAAALLEGSEDTRLLGLDRDGVTLELAARRLSPFGSRVCLRHADFRDVGAEARAVGLTEAHAILLDLGWSSYQLAHGGRGFSFAADEPLDMRLDTRQSLRAADLVNRAAEPELARLLLTYGEERQARRIARRVAQARARGPIATSRALAELVVSAIPGHRRSRRIHPATRTFQALRIAVNDELGSLEAGLPQAGQLLASRGRLGVIAFHSLEDRLVKRGFRAFARQGPWRVLTPKPIRPGPAEVADNPRARSARFRVLERDGRAR